VIVQQQNEPLVAPGTQRDVASLHLQMSATWNGSELCRRQHSC
jgi:hypothetical protein